MCVCVCVCVYVCVCVCVCMCQVLHTIFQILYMALEVDTVEVVGLSSKTFPECLLKDTKPGIAVYIATE